MKRLKPKALLKLYLREALTGAATAPPRCPHFGVCGGCEYQNYPYESQVAAKAATWQRLAADAKITLPAPTIIPAPEPYGYRQRMDYVCAFGAAGLRVAGSHRRVVALTECPLLGERGFAAFRRARDLAAAENLPFYDYLRHTGFLRYLVVRQTRGAEILLSLVTKSTLHAAEIEKIARTLLAEKLAASVYWLVQPSRSDLSFGDCQRFWGSPLIRETYHGKNFYLGANTFAQANPAVAEIAYQKIVEANRGAATVGDLYSGAGTISALLAPLCGYLTAVESIADNTDLAARHYAEQQIDNVEMLTADAAKFLQTAAARAENTGAGDFAAVVVNPPRAGLETAAATALAALAPPRITYMSCNPQTLLTDLVILQSRYDAETITLFDMFPQTHHWETLVVLRRRGSYGL